MRTDIASLTRVLEFVHRFEAGMTNSDATRHETQDYGEDRKPRAEPLSGLDQQKELDQAKRKKDKKNSSDHLKPVGN